MTPRDAAIDAWAALGNMPRRTLTREVRYEGRVVGTYTRDAMLDQLIEDFEATAAEVECPT